MHNNKKNRGAVGGTLLALLFFLATFAILFFATSNFAQSSGQEGVRTTREALERAAVLCYASEGFYPPSLQYIEENYGVFVDRSRYVVRYEPWAANVMPNILVIAR